MARSGPSPLPVHLGIAASVCLQDPVHGQSLLQGLMGGIRKYQLHPYHRDLPDLPVVWQGGTVRVVKAVGTENEKGAQAPLLLIPSMINGPEILDLMEGRSLMRWLAAQGRDVYLLEWGRSVEDAGQADFDTALRDRLIPALTYISEQAGGPVDALGYCMGGTLLAALAQHAPDKLRKVVFLATPWDFHAGDKKLQQMVSIWAAGGMALMAQHGVLPASWVQSVFASVDPHQAVRKFTDFAAIDDDSERARRFVAVEDWLNDAADLPRAVAHTCIQDWYLDNAPGAGRWQAGGQMIDPAAITLPALVAVAATDRLVSPESSAALYRALPHATWLEIPTGHIGLIAGEKAVEGLWAPMDEWLRR